MVTSFFERSFNEETIAEREIHLTQSRARDAECRGRTLPILRFCVQMDIYLNRHKPMKETNTRMPQIYMAMIRRTWEKVCE